MDYIIRNHQAAELPTPHQHTTASSGKTATAAGVAPRRAKITNSTTTRRKGLSLLKTWDSDIETHTVMASYQL